MVIINTKKILSQYPSVNAFCRDPDINLHPVDIQNLKKNKSGTFQENSKMYKIFRKLEKLGYVARKEVEEEVA